jgi:hypothetical protein
LVSIRISVLASWPPSIIPLTASVVAVSVNLSIPSDDTAGTVTGIAIGNSSQLLIRVTLRDDAGALLPPGTGSIQLNPNGHFSDTLAHLFPQVANVHGTIEFDTPAGARSAC